MDNIVAIWETITDKCKDKDKQRRFDGQFLSHFQRNPGPVAAVRAEERFQIRWTGNPSRVRVSRMAPSRSASRFDNICHSMSALAKHRRTRQH
jgi:hypothetical protein